MGFYSLTMSNLPGRSLTGFQLCLLKNRSSRTGFLYGRRLPPSFGSIFIEGKSDIKKYFQKIRRGRQVFFSASGEIGSTL